VKGCVMYVPWYPCVECAKAIIQSGISEVVGYAPDLSERKWGPEFSLSAEMFKEAGVTVRLIPRLQELPVGN
jgi:dCMP deaminase